MKHKITKTLIEAWAYTFAAGDDYAEDAYNSFLSTLKREPIEDNENMRNGREFEDLCYRMANGEKVVEDCLLPEINPVSGEVFETKKYPKWYDGARMILPYIENGQIQVPVSCDLTVSGQKFRLFGICDVVKAGVIYDIKFNNKELGNSDLYGKYTDYSQHSLYLKALPEANRFIYLVSDGHGLYTEEYTRSTSKPIEEHISNFWSWLNSKPDLMQIYREKWAV